MRQMLCKCNTAGLLLHRQSAAYPPGRAHKPTWRGICGDEVHVHVFEFDMGVPCRAVRIHSFAAFYNRHVCSAQTRVLQLGTHT